MYITIQIQIVVLNGMLLKVHTKHGPQMCYACGLGSTVALSNSS